MLVNRDSISWPLIGWHVAGQLDFVVNQTPRYIHFCGISRNLIWNLTNTENISYYHGKNMWVFDQVDGGYDVYFLNIDLVSFLMPWNFSKYSWWRHQMEIFYGLLALCAGNSPVTGDFSAQRPVTRSFDVFFDLRLIKRSGKQSWGWCTETSSRPLWRHCNVPRVAHCH